METMIYSSKKEGKDTWQSILGYLAKYPNILFHGCYITFTSGYTISPKTTFNVQKIQTFFVLNIYQSFFFLPL